MLTVVKFFCAVQGEVLHERLHRSMAFKLFRHTRVQTHDATKRIARIER